MQILRKWLSEHTAEDIVRAHRAGTAVYFAHRELSLEACLTCLLTHDTDHLMIRELPHTFWWLRAEDALGTFHGKIILNDLRHGDDDNGSSSSSADDGQISDGSNGNWSILQDPAVRHCSIHPVPVVLPETCLRGILQECTFQLPLAVVSADGEEHVMGIITAMDLLHYFYLYGYHLNYLMSRPGKDITSGDPIEVILHSQPVEACLRRILPNRRGIVAVVDGKGALMTGATIGTFLKYAAKKGQFESLLDLPIISFLRAQGGAWTPMRFNERHNFGETLKRILEAPDHLLWKLDEHGRPLGLITMQHLLDYIHQLIS